MWTVVSALPLEDNMPNSW